MPCSVTDAEVDDRPLSTVDSCSTPGENLPRAAASGTDLVTAATASIACLGNIGPGLAAVGASQNYSGLADSAKLILAAGMIIGRLEVFTVLGLLSRSFWRP